MDELDRSACWGLLIRMFPRGLIDRAVAAELGTGWWRGLSAEELADLIGRCLWDVFSNNHVVTAGTARVNLGTFRRAAELIAAFRSASPLAGPPRRPPTYLDFYLGTLGVRADQDLVAFYRAIFRRMRLAGFGWRYVHPRLLLLDLGAAGESPNVAADLPAGRDPGTSAADGELAELQEAIDRDYRDSVRRARMGRLPALVRGHYLAYGRLPEGWPPG